MWAQKKGISLVLQRENNKTKNGELLVRIRHVSIYFPSWTRRVADHRCRQNRISSSEGVERIREKGNQNATLIGQNVQRKYYKHGARLH